ncbi:DUF99 family protein [Candidatus Woesearchaeota archaeon]|nr:DUF99 family protein [Candidatus Woesearchaeota archaeon]
MKKEIRLLGFDDSAFNKFKDKKVKVIGCFFRGGSFLDGVLSFDVEIDGMDSTQKIINAINKSKFKTQIQAILLDGIAFGGFNIIDIKELFNKTKIPMIVVIRRIPNISKIKLTLAILGMKKKIKLIEKAGKVHKIGKIYVQCSGVSLNHAKQILKISCTHSYLPEPIRVAHLIGAGLYFGESKGKA